MRVPQHPVDRALLDACTGRGEKDHGQPAAPGPPGGLADEQGAAAVQRCKDDEPRVQRLLPSRQVALVLDHAEGDQTEEDRRAEEQHGALDLVELRAGESPVLDSGHLVAFDDGVSYVTRKAARGLVQTARGLVQTLKSGAGLVLEFTGPGRLRTQSRNPKELTSRLTARLPFRKG